MSRRTMFVALLALMMAAPMAMAQAAPAAPDSNNNNRGDRGNRSFDPAEFRKRMEDRLKEQLGVNDDEWKVLQPKVTKVFEAQRDARGGGSFFGRGGSRGGDSNSSDRQRSAVETASRDLQTVVEKKDATADEINAKLTAFREARDKARQALVAAQKDLKDVLTQRQEAVLVSMGMLD